MAKFEGEIRYKLDLACYSKAELKSMYLQQIITKAEMNDELDDRDEGYDERLATFKDRREFAA